MNIEVPDFWKYFINTFAAKKFSDLPLQTKPHDSVALPPS
jgi:hypothetical protein